MSPMADGSGCGRFLRSRPNQDELEAFGVAPEHGESDGGGADFRGSPKWPDFEDERRRSETESTSVSTSQGLPGQFLRGGG
jgi:hypothetical protein